ncbi:uncharacterized protein BX663DRAFT_463866 [Cokeromyces recurvatus]|uniref:uncharacterized protein n=1 Tax=Cokeromyces recurvatus TaxID=90255 RepID=UPI00221EE436|nr:uncharacterized protein BX663DRAFT_463866 [Cokeromyces recurvatus]KAI7907617.1 hypothetical protein BX663DRAFT_463866 [Cokeromyces recurvatus]
MYQKIFIIASIALSVANAHPGLHVRSAGTTATTTSNFKFTETYPEPYVIPTAKPEWLELIKNINVTKAPVYKNLNNAGPQPEVPGQDPYCDWTFTGCFGKDDLYQCPKGQWALTYDDGPSEYSPKLYDYLDSVNVKVTFFMVGGQVVKYPEYALRAYQSGHEIAMHTWSHNYMTTLTNEQIVAELKWNELAIKEVTGVSPRYFRPPYGDIDDRVRDVAAALGFIPIIWNHDTNDWAYASNPKGYKESWIDGNVTLWAKEAATAEVGGISLEHDLYKETVDVAIRILPVLQKKYTLVPAGQCNNVQVYKENMTEIATNATTTSTTVATSTSEAPIVAATSSAPTNAATANTDDVSTSVNAASASAPHSGSTSTFTSVSVLTLGTAIVAAMALL